MKSNGETSAIFVVAAILTGTPGLAMAAEHGVSSAPDARFGFELALRTGYAVPFGSYSGNSGSAMSGEFSGQVPFVVDIGGKLTRNIFLGGYLGLGFGGTSGAQGRLCDAERLSCVTETVRIGVQAAYQFMPDARQDPWIGYGIGYESSGVSISSGGTATQSSSENGVEFAHFMGGLDFRLTRLFGIGPFVDFSLGEYFKQKNDQGDGTVTTSISNKALHEWLALGVRCVFFP